MHQDYLRHIHSCIISWEHFLITIDFFDGLISAHSKIHLLGVWLIRDA